MRKLKLFFVLLFLVVFLNPTSKVFADDGELYIDSNGVYYTEYGGKYTVTGYDKISSEVIIPEVVNGKIVNSIGENAFTWCFNLKSITIPEGVTSIGKDAFYKCINLTSINIPEKGLTSIGNYAFFDCRSLKSITIPEGVKSIGSGAFNSCGSLIRVTMPAEGLNSIEGWTFASCNSLKNIKIPKGVISIGKNAFDNCESLTSVTIPEGVTSIGSNAFEFCESLTSVIIPEGVTSIGNDAFLFCKSLTSVTIPEGMTSIEDNMFLGCSSLTSIILPKSVTNIGNGAFAQCSNLTSVTIPEGVTKIDDGSFYYSYMKILGYTNSYAHTYATTKGYPFESLGDAYDKIFKVKFNTNCITTIPDTSLKFGSMITNIPKLVKDGWEFHGWYRDAKFSKPFNIHSDKVSSDMTLFAKWIANVEFDTQGGTTIAPLQITTSGKIPKPDNPVKTGYTFNGWYKEDSCINPWDFSTDEVGKNITLYAKWTKTTYTVNFNSQGGSMVESKSAYYNTLIEIPTPPIKEGYTFNGWYKDSNCTLPWNFDSSLVKYDWTLYAKWTINKYNVNFDSQGGSTVSDQNIYYNTEIAEPVAPTKKGYTFGGWYKEVSCINEWNFATDKVTKDMTLYSRWIPNKYSVNFNSQGGSTVSNKSTDYNSTITAPSAPTRTGYTFDGWYKEAGCLNAWNFATDKVTKDTTLYAKWKLNKYSVSFNSQGGSTVSDKNTDYNTSIMEPSVPTRTGYKFNGWYTAASGGIKAVFPYVVKDNITLYAQWSDIAPNIPTGLTAKPLSYNSNKLTWSAVTGVSGYEVYRSTSSTGKYILLTSTTALSYTNIGLTTNSTYYYKIRAYKIVGKTKVYSSYTIVVSAKPIVSVPKSLVVKRVNSISTKLIWGAVNGASGYEIYRSTSSTGKYTLLTSTTSSNYTNAKLTVKKTYYYKVRAYRIVGKTKVYSEYTNIVFVKL